MLFYKKFIFFNTYCENFLRVLGVFKEEERESGFEDPKMYSKVLGIK